jgi:indolepyruvate ferredoxin oxidoreductase beta subunit
MTKSHTPFPKVDIFLAGVGGQGVLLASEIIGHAGIAAGCDVKKSEVHGMSQRGGSVTSSVRLGTRVYSPLIEQGKADILVSLDYTEGRRYAHYLRKGGLFLEPPAAMREKLQNPRTFNVAAVGLLSTHLDIPVASWLDAIAANVPQRFLEQNKNAFFIGRETGSDNHDLG